MGSILGNSEIRSTIFQTVMEAEDMEYESVLKSFYDCRVLERLCNINHQIIQGRRGTGKTHLLLVLKEKFETEKQHCLYINIKHLGSEMSSADSVMPAEYRAVQLIRDFLRQLHSDFIDFFSAQRDIIPCDKTCEVDLLLQHLYEECNTRGEVVDEFSKSKGSRRTRTKATDSDLKFRLTGFLSGGVNMGTSEHDDDEDEKAVNYKTSGYSFERVVFYNVHDCLRQLAEITGFRFVLLIDEWSCIDMDVQPYFANFLRRCIMDGRHFTVKIASVTGKTQYRKKVDDRECGFEVGADIAVAIDFDELYQIDKNPQKAFFNLYTILLMHLQANNLLEECSTDNLVEMLFTDLKSAFLLVRACEGNVRDFLSILKRCIDELDGIGNTGEWIDSQTVINAAKDWCEQDKLYNMENRLKELLSEIAIFVAHTKKNRGFVMPASYLSHPQLSELFYSRVLHVVQKSRHFPNLGKETMAIVVLDFGAYSEYLMANHDIFFLANDGFESMLFGEFDLSQYDDVMCPFDERRDFKMCFFDPRLNPDIAPSFLG